jgi:thymidylate kinase
VDFRLYFPQEHVENWWLWRRLVGVTPRPDAAFLLLIPVAESVSRSDVKGEPFRDPPELLAQRLTEYQARARAGHWQELDGQHGVDELAAEIRARVNLLTQAGVPRAA